MYFNSNSVSQMNGLFQLLRLPKQHTLNLKQTHIHPFHKVHQYSYTKAVLTQPSFKELFLSTSLTEASFSLPKCVKSIRD